MNANNENRIRTFKIVAGLLGLALLAGGLALWASDGATAAAKAPAGVLAKVGDAEITQAEVENLLAAQLKELERRRFTLIEEGLERAISDKLVALAAQEKGVTVDAYLEQEVGSKVGAITDGEIDAFYEARKDQINRPKEEVAEQIRGYLAGQRRQTAYQQVVQALREKIGVRSYLEPMRVEVAASGPVHGPDSAPVTIVEFSDFQCPFCGRVNPTLEKVKETYSGRIRLVFRQFPLTSIHPQAWKAAEASLCADEQGKFWEMHDAMFADQRGLGVDQLKEKAAGLGLDGGKFGECLDSGRYHDRVQADLQAGQEAGVSGTPAMFVNGRLVSGAVPYEQISQVIDDELRRSSTVQ